ncbi:MAG: hypothetical protein NT023_05935 [Armatimonadetes bacterium]|nr:hypothetical protein [Armatimonadota bacterium]
MGGLLPVRFRRSVWLYENELEGAFRSDRHELQSEGVAVPVLERECRSDLAPDDLVSRSGDFPFDWSQEAV